MVSWHAEVAQDGVDSLAAAGGCRWSLNPDPGTDGESCQSALDVEEEKEDGQHPHCLRPGHEVVNEWPFANQLRFINAIIIEKF